MSRVPIHRTVKLRMEIIGPEVGALVIFLFVVGLADPPAALWFVFVAGMVLLQTYLFYRLGRISEQMSREG